MIQSLFLSNDCNDGSERLQPGVDCLQGNWRGEMLCFFVNLCGVIG